MELLVSTAVPVLMGGLLAQVLSSIQKLLALLENSAQRRQDAATVLTNMAKDLCASLHPMNNSYEGADPLARQFQLLINPSGVNATYYNPNAIFWNAGDVTHGWQIISSLYISEPWIPTWFRSANMPGQFRAWQRAIRRIRDIGRSIWAVQLEFPGPVQGPKYEARGIKKTLKLLNFATLIDLQNRLPSGPLRQLRTTNTVNGKAIGLITIEIDTACIDELNPQLNRTCKSRRIQNAP